MTIAAPASRPVTQDTASPDPPRPHITSRHATSSSSSTRDLGCPSRLSPGRTAG